MNKLVIYQIRMMFHHQTRHKIVIKFIDVNQCDNYIWRPPSLSDLTPIIFYMGLTHLASEISKWFISVRHVPHYIPKKN